MEIHCRVNGHAVAFQVEPYELMANVLRNRFGLKGLKVACERQICGACTVLLDGEPVSACCTLALEMRGRDVETIEGVGNARTLHDLQTAFIEEAGLQCGYCTPGMVLTSLALLRKKPHPELADITEWLHGNICRCASYAGIVAAIQRAARAAAKEGSDGSYA